MPFGGFGHSPFGTGRFGWTDWGEILIWGAIPEIYRRKDREQPNEPLRAIVDAFKSKLEDLRLSIERLPTLRDPYEIPMELLDYLGYDIDQVTDENKPDRLRRSAVGNAPRLYVKKGSDKGYTILAGMEGFIAQIIPRWATPCGGTHLQDAGPSVWVPHFDDVPADTVTNIFDDFFPATGSTLLGLRFTTATEPTLLSVDSVVCSNNSVNVILGSIGAVAAPFDLSIAALPTILPVFPGSVEITVRVEGVNTTIIDDGSGGLEGSALPSGGTIDYSTGVMIGVTSNLDAGTDVSMVYKKFITLTLGVDYTVNLALGEVTLITPSSSGDSFRITYTAYIPCDLEFSGEFDLYPIPLYPPRCTICRTHLLIIRIAKDVIDEVIGTIGNIASTFDLSTATGPTLLPVAPGSISIAVQAGATTYTIVDDSIGGLSGSILPLGGTIDYNTGAMTGVTSLLDADSSVVMTYADPSASVEKLLERVFYYKPIHVELGLRDVFGGEDLEQISESWGDIQQQQELLEQVSETWSSSTTMNTATYWILNNTSMNFNDPNYTTCIAG